MYSVLPVLLIVANNGLIRLCCSHAIILKFTDLDINGTAKLLRQFNSATDITFNGGKKQESVFHCG